MQIYGMITAVTTIGAAISRAAIPRVNSTPFTALCMCARSYSKSMQAVEYILELSMPGSIADQDERMRTCLRTAAERA